MTKGFNTDESMTFLPSINANYLVVFEAIFRTGSVTAAAKELGLTQSGASNALAQLRLIFDDPLFERVGNRMVPTPCALEVAPNVSAGVAALSRALAPREFSAATMHRTLTLAMPDYVQMALLARLAALLTQQAPKADLRVVTTAAQAAPEALATGEVDVYVGFVDVVPDDHLGWLLYEDDFVLLLRSDHPAHKAPEAAVTLEDWLAYGHVVVSGQPRSPTLLDRALSDIGAPARRVAAILDHASMVSEVLLCTDWIAAVGRRWGQEDAANSRGQLVTAPCPIALSQGRIRVVIHRRQEADPANAWLRGLLQQAAMAPHA